MVLSDWVMLVVDISAYTNEIIFRFTSPKKKYTAATVRIHAVQQHTDQQTDKGIKKHLEYFLFILNHL
jgi:hypothetical protein